MLIIFAVPILLTLIQLGNLNFEWVNDGLIQLQSLCAQGYHLSQQHELLGAMVCGQPPISQQIITEWSRTGLLPILIGAGTHFIFLEQILNRLLRRHPVLRKTALFLFVCVTGFSPALSRGLIAQSLSDLNQKWKLGLGFPQTWAVSLLICLIICPNWIASLGFMISAQCGLLMYLSYKLGSREQQRLTFARALSRKIGFAIVRAVVFMIGLMPLFKIVGLPPLHPYALITQVIGIPTAGLLLFPIGVVERLIGSLQIPLDPFWNEVAQLIHQISAKVPAVARITFQPLNGAQTFWAWSYIGSFFAYVYLLDLTRRHRIMPAFMRPKEAPRARIFSNRLS